ncbi:Hypothetical protein FKW44_019496 [Caligus rogercresseyi]|uniref:Uncharacterized protein n=1 Tax=Caligus rogercresseyi TaxID=217165 RepID=A0A7T8GWK0_CALRO|nr:Hypothetical protein FKW44_019496 [Caligus rogercresseyi]
MSLCCALKEESQHSDIYWQIQKDQVIHLVGIGGSLHSLSPLVRYINKKIS